MTTELDEGASLFELWVEHLVLTGERLTPGELCEKRPQETGNTTDLCRELEALIEDYDRLSATLEGAGRAAEPAIEASDEEGEGVLPSFAGFRTIERLGRGGSGDVYKLEDKKLGRTVAGKTLRPDSPLRSTVADFLAEARSLALFDDPRIVRLFDYRDEGPEPLLLMEYVEGFDLLTTGRSLDPKKRAEVLAEVAEAVDFAHQLGVQHRDLKPSNILLDASLKPRILDFGISSSSDRGHFRGTLPYMAPELLDPGSVVDARSDVYALGVILYELLCGRRPYEGASPEELASSIRRGQPKLPAELDDAVPEPLQAIALKAMELAPEDRYSTAGDLALELRRFVADRPVTARPKSYRGSLSRRLNHHLEEIRDWQRLKLVYPHEVGALEATYRRLEDRDDDWIVQSRRLSLSRIALYSGVFVAALGALLYFLAYLNDGVGGLWRPLMALGTPWLALSLLARWLYVRQHQGTAIAFFLATSVLLPAFVLIALPELGWWPSTEEATELFEAGPLSNRDLQVATLVAVVWAFWLAHRTRTVALASSFTLMAFLFYMSALTDRGLRRWLEDGNWDRLSVHTLPLLLLFGCGALVAERDRRFWISKPLYLSTACLLLILLELLALDGELFRHFGLSLEAWRPQEAPEHVLETVVAMVLIGVSIYGVAAALERWGTALMMPSARLLFVIAPFAVLHPLFYLSSLGEFSTRYDGVYLGLSLGVTFLSHHRQRRSFYFAGLLNSGAALFWITDHHDWWDRPSWALAVLLAGLLLLAVGAGLVRFERLSRRDL